MTTSVPALCVGEAIVGEGNEVADVDLVIGDKSGPAGVAFASGLASQRLGHPSVIAVLKPNMAVKPSTLLVNRVTISGQEAAVLFFDPVQQGVARAVVDAVAENIVPKDKAESLVVIICVYIHLEAANKVKLFENNYTATKIALKRAMAGEPRVADVEKTRLY